MYICNACGTSQSIGGECCCCGSVVQEENVFEIVFCKNCKYAPVSRLTKILLTLNTLSSPKYFCSVSGLIVGDTDFCSKGMKREGGEE